MSIKQNQLVILKYLSSISDSSFPSNESVIKATNISIEDYETATQLLFKNDLINGGKTNISITSYGRLYLEELEALPISQLPNNPTAPQQKIIKSIWVWVITNPMATAIIGGIIAIIVGTLILKYYHIK